MIFVTRHRSKEPEFLLARELKACDRRAAQDRLNFLGGKRLMASQGALDVAVQRSMKETGKLLHDDFVKLREQALPLVYWDANNKYVYFFIELTCEDDLDIDWRCAGVDGAHRLEWVGITQLLDETWVRSEIHAYAGKSVLGLRDEGVLHHLMEIFDAAAPPERELEPKESPGMGGDAGVKADFDVVSAILKAASKLRDDIMLPPTRVREALRILPKTDLRKLQLRFHPDKLTRQLGARAATEEEMSLSTAAFQLFASITDDVHTLKDQIKEHELKLAMYATEYTGKTSHNPVAEVATLLENIKMASPSHQR